METRKTSVIRRAAALLCALVLVVGLAPVQVLADAGRIETLYVGESRTLEQTGAASWESSSDETATVTADETDSDKAVVTAEAAGDVTIKALGGDGSELQAWEFRVKERSVHINKVSDTYCVAADAAPTMTVTMDGVESVHWSVANDDGNPTTAMSIDAETGKVTYGSLTAASETVVITAVAKGMPDVKDSFTMTLTKGETTVAFETTEVHYGVQTLEAVVKCGDTVVDDAAVTYSIVGEPAPDYAALSNGRLTMKELNSVTIRADYAGDGKYKAAGAERTFTAGTCQVTMDVGEFAVEKNHDGTDALTEQNKTDIEKALQDAFRKARAFEGDDVTLAVDLTDAVYSAADVYTDKTVTVRVRLDGADAAKYSLADTFELKARIHANEPKNGEFDLTAAAKQTLDGVTISGSRKGTDGTYWVKAGDELTLSKQDGIGAYSVNGNSIVGGGLTVGGENSQLKDGWQFYIGKTENGKVIFYGPYTVKLQQDDDAPKFLVEKVEGIGFDNKDMAYTVDITDDGSGVDVGSIQYYVGGAAPDADTKWKDANAKKDTNPNGYTVTIQMPASGTLYLRAADCVGNAAESSAIRTLVLEDNEPTVKLTMDTADEDSIEQSHQVTVEAADAEKVGNAPYSYSGIQRVTYELKQGDAVALSETYTNETPQEMEQIPGVRTWNETLEFPGTYTDKDGNPLTLNGTYTLEVTAVDFCGNEGSQKCELRFDNTAPELTVEADKSDNSYDEGEYFNDTFAVTMTVKDNRQLDADKLMPVVMRGGEAVTESETDVTYAVTADATAYKVTFKVNKSAADGIYTFAISGTDHAGNALVLAESGNAGQNAVTVENGVFTTRAKVLDTEAPTFTLAIDRDGAANKDLQDGRYYFNADFTVKARVSDTNVDNGRLHLERFTQGAETGVDFSAVTDGEVEKWSKLAFSDVAAGETVSVDGLYRYRISGADKAGNPLIPAAKQTEIETKDAETYLTYYIARDTKAPDGVLTVRAAKNGDPYYEVKMDGTIGKAEPFRKETEAYILLKTDDNSPVRLSYNVWSIVEEGKQEKIQQGPTDYAFQQSAGCSMEGERIFWMTDITVTDRAGNTTTLATTNKIYLDNTAPSGGGENIDRLAPEIEFKVDKDVSTYRGAVGPLYDQDVPLSISVSDPNPGTKSSGLGNVVYQVFVDGKPVEKEYLHHKNDVYDPNGNENEGKYDDQKLDFTLNELRTVSDKDNAIYNNNNIKVTVTAYDNAGNLATSSYEFGIDKTAPDIEVVFDNNSAENGKYFKAARTATVNVYERNFDPTKIVIKTQPDVSGAADINNWKCAKDNSEGSNGDRDCWSYTIPYSRDGNYTLRVEGADMLGTSAGEVKYLAANGGAATAPQDFVVDLTAPTVEVRYDNHDVANGKYYKADRTATIIVSDTNFAGRNDITISATAGGTAPVVSFSADGRAVLPFTQDGTYRITGTVTDQAGNVSRVLSEDEFVLDKTAPVVEISGVADRSANNDTVAPVIRFTDANFDPNGTTLTMTGANNGAVSYDGDYADVENGRVFSYADFARVQEVDDIYTLTAGITDLAGNTADSSIMFSANRFGSVYTFSDDTEALRGHYIQTERDLVFTETNVDSLQRDTIALKLTRNGVPMDLKENTDYTIAAAGGGGSWSQYRYTIDKSLIADEGVYAVAVYSVDAAGNINENIDEVKKAELNFGVDKTPPVVVPIDFESNTQYAVAGKAVELEIKDNLALKSVEILLDGEAVACSASGETYTFNVPQSNHKQSVVIQAADEAGNVCTVNVDDVLVSTNILARWYNNTPLFFGSLGGVAVAAAVVIVLLRKKRNQAEETAQVQ